MLSTILGNKDIYDFNSIATRPCAA